MDYSASMDALPMARDGLIGACCSLGTEELGARLADWRALRERAEHVLRDDDGVRLTLQPNEGLDAMARLIALEAKCCPFYRFTLEVTGTQRHLAIDAGPGGGEAVAALLGLG